MTKMPSKSRLWTARILSGAAILFMLFDSVSKFLKPAAVVEGTLDLGFSEYHLPVIGTLGLLSTILFAIPRTSILGAVLLTGFFGGVVATHVRMDNPLFTHTLFPIYLAVFIWGSLWLKDENVRNLIPFQKK